MDPGLQSLVFFPVLEEFEDSLRTLQIFSFIHSFKEPSNMSSADGVRAMMTLNPYRVDVVVTFKGRGRKERLCR